MSDPILPKSVTCPTCDAIPGVECTDVPGVHMVLSAHWSRICAAREKAANGCTYECGAAAELLLAAKEMVYALTGHGELVNDAYTKLKCAIADLERTPS